MRDVDLHIDEEHVLRVRSLQGRVTPTDSNTIAILDDPKSFRIRVTSGIVDIAGPDLAALLNEYVFNYHGSPLRDLRAHTDGTQLVLGGIMHKGVDIPFEITSDLSLDPDGRVRSHPTKMKILGVNGSLLLHALGLHLDKVLDLRGSRGAAVAGDDILLDPERIIPPPAITGRLAAARVTGDYVRMEFMRTADDAVVDATMHADSAAHHYIYFRGGQLRFGKLTMTDTDLLIVDADQHDAFDLYMARYNEQLVAGFTRNLPDYGLRVSMPDYRTVATLAQRNRMRDSTNAGVLARVYRK